ncbi:hypothetical protein JN531_017000 (plasmid) [Flagellatimonas centrodinii]|uniref:hypothetical protein n=1 Tax=Flagellatimonas centrodinii TaxID=2806210 RepID=UPI001FED4013|nr:hypothetical protein [Flagellatimonas centrodinii]ULQ48331.1 hypothetical protein JN531_017000 [Flagellatimonas centrodinii]
MNEAGGKGEGWTLWASQELAIARLQRSRVYVGAFGVVGVLILGIYITHLHGRVDYLSTNQLMYCVADGEGMYRSTRDIPEATVLNYGQRFLANFKQYDSSTVDVNFARAREMMRPDLALSYKPAMDQEAARIRRLSLSQWFTPLNETLTETEGGFIFTVQGRIGGYTGSTPLKPAETTVRIEMQRVVPSEGRPEGLLVVKSSG